jgi:hypothetical protein
MPGSLNQVEAVKQPLLEQAKIIHSMPPVCQPNSGFAEIPYGVIEMESRLSSKKEAFSDMGKV